MDRRSATPEELPPLTLSVLRELDLEEAAAPGDFLFVCDQDDPDTASPLLSAAMPIESRFESA